MYFYLKNQGFTWNKKRIYRVYCDMKLNLRKKPKKRLPSRSPTPLIQPIRANICWSMDFMADALISVKKFRTFNLIDDFNREGLAIDAATSITGKRVVDILTRICGERGYPKMIRMDNGPEFRSISLVKWFEKNNVKLAYIEPGKPAQNAYIERFNRSFREEVLDMYLFKNTKEVNWITEGWLQEYNYNRPHESLGGKTPVQFANSMEGNCLTA